MPGAVAAGAGHRAGAAGGRRAHRPAHRAALGRRLALPPGRLDGGAHRGRAARTRPAAWSPAGDRDRGLYSRAVGVLGPQGARGRLGAEPSGGANPLRPGFSARADAGDAGHRRWRQRRRRARAWSQAGRAGHHHPQHLERARHAARRAGGHAQCAPPAHCHAAAAGPDAARGAPGPQAAAALQRLHRQRPGHGGRADRVRPHHDVRPVPGQLLQRVDGSQTHAGPPLRHADHARRHAQRHGLCDQRSRDAAGRDHARPGPHGARRHAAGRAHPPGAAVRRQHRRSHRAAHPKRQRPLLHRMGDGRPEAQRDRAADAGRRPEPAASQQQGRVVRGRRGLLLERQQHQGRGRSPGGHRAARRPAFGQRGLRALEARCGVAARIPRAQGPHRPGLRAQAAVHARDRVGLRGRCQVHRCAAGVATKKLGHVRPAHRHAVAAHGAGGARPRGDPSADPQPVDPAGCAGAAAGIHRAAGRQAAPAPGLAIAQASGLRAATAVLAGHAAAGQRCRHLAVHRLRAPGAHAGRTERTRRARRHAHRP